jgi:molybdopterin/thiamine biosynthesis adenylyltransferase
MALTNRQIERYSRQIIVPDFGGVAQERLLAARILLIANHTYADSVLPYLVGAGVGQIDLRADLDPAASAAIIARMRDLNPDSTIRVVDLFASKLSELGELDLALVLVDDSATLDQVRALCDRPHNVATNFQDTLSDTCGIVLARLDHPARIAVIPRRPPCPRCASTGDLLAPIGARTENAGFTATLAALEAIKLLARFAPAPNPTLIDLRGYESSVRIVASTQGSTCTCAAARAAESS